MVMPIDDERRALHGDMSPLNSRLRRIAVHVIRCGKELPIGRWEGLREVGCRR